MIRLLALYMLIAAIISTGCQNTPPAPGLSPAKQDSLEKQSVSDNEDTLFKGKLETRMQIAVHITADSVPLSFTVINHADTTMRFCKWETPFEPRLGKYFEIMDDQGNEAAFKGAMARRIMPPPVESYIQVAPHDSVQTTINLANKYTLSNTSYTVHYTGSGVSGLAVGNTVHFMLVKP